MELSSWLCIPLQARMSNLKSGINLHAGCNKVLMSVMVPAFFFWALHRSLICEAMEYVTFLEIYFVKEPIHTLGYISAVDVWTEST